MPVKTLSNLVGEHFIPYENSVIIGCVDYWLENEKEIYNWLDKCVEGGRNSHNGMTVTFKSEEDLTLFLLRWQI